MEIVRLSISVGREHASNMVKPTKTDLSQPVFDIGDVMGSLGVHGGKRVCDNEAEKNRIGETP